MLDLRCRPVDVASILSRFEKVTASRSRPNTWQAVCPTHEDHTPSLRIWVGDNGAVLIRCYSNKRCCTFEGILQAVGLTKRELFPMREDEDERAPARRWTPEVKRREVASYDYTDEKGNVLFQVVRFEPKSFAQRRLVAGKWTWGLGSDADCRRVIYRLDRIAAAAVPPVLVLEGEKDVHTAERMKLLATCNPGGTGMGWRPEYSAMLRGRRVVVVPDNDDAGREHAAYVAGSLVMGGAASVRVATLPGPAKDLTEWAERGGTRDALVKLIQQTAEWKPMAVVA